MLQNYRELTFRPAAKPGIQSPLTVRSTGHYRIFRSPERNKARHFTQLFWICAGQLSYRRMQQSFTAAAGEVFYYAAKEPHHIEALQDSCEYYWITFDGASIGDWLARSGISIEPRRAGSCPVDLFEEIRQVVQMPSLSAEKHAAELGLRLLLGFVDASGGERNQLTSREESICCEAEAHIEKHFKHPGFGIETVASLMRVHRTTLYRVYHDQRGISPSAYLQRLRLKHGLELLRHSQLNITEISQASGFSDPNYFAKVVRRATGDPPKRVRHASVKPSNDSPQGPS